MDYGGPRKIMRNKIKHKKITWIDIENPQPSDVEFLREKFHFDPIDMEEINKPTYRPKAEDRDDYIFLVLHFPVYNSKKKATVSCEMEIFITEDHLITLHPLPIPPLKSAFEGCENHTSVAKKYMEKTTGHLLYYLIERLFDSCFPKIDDIAEKIDRIEDHIFQGREKEMVKEISIVQRDILDFRRTLKPQQSVLESLATMQSKVLQKKLQMYFRDIIGSNMRIWNALETHKETIEALKDTNESLLSNKISEIMKILTIMTFFALPLTVVSSYFGMNVFAESSAINHPFTPIAILGAMVLIIVTMIAYFKKKKWL